MGNLNSYTSIIFLAAATLIVLLLIIFIVLSICNHKKLKKISKHCKTGNLAQTIELYYDKIEHLTNNISTLSDRFNQYEKDNQNALQRVGIVNFDAFSDISGNLSFSLAILNRHDNGFIITSLYSHDSSNVYIRTITNGKTQTHLLDEEIEALAKAKSSY